MSKDYKENRVKEFKMLIREDDGSAEDWFRSTLTQTHNKALEEAEKIIKENGLHLGYKNNVLEAIKAIKDKKI